jgi:hypothetical protein
VCGIPKGKGGKHDPVVFASTLQLRNSVQAFNTMYATILQVTQGCSGIGEDEQVQGFWGNFVKQQTNGTDVTPPGDGDGYNFLHVACALKALHKDNGLETSVDDLTHAADDLSIDPNDQFDSTTAMWQYHSDELAERDDGACPVRPPAGCWFVTHPLCKHLS